MRETDASTTNGLQPTSAVPLRLPGQATHGTQTYDGARVPVRPEDASGQAHWVPARRRICDDENIDTGPAADPAANGCSQVP